jgi:hypothetical protein
VFYGASFGASDFGGNFYFNFALTILIEIPANFIGIDGCERSVYVPYLSSGFFLRMRSKIDSVKPVFH